MIEPRLRAAGERWFPATPPIAARARLRLRELPAAPRRRRGWLLAVALSALVLSGAAVAAAFHDAIPGVHIDRDASLPEVSLVAPPLGRATTLSTARQAVPFTILRSPSLDTPERVFLDHDAQGSPVVTLIYGDRNGGRARLVLTEWVARSVLFYKLVDNETPVDYVDVAGSFAVWIAGPEHEVFYLGTSRGEGRLGGYVSGNSLVWHRGGVTYRLEADVTLPEALEIATALRTR